MYVVSFRGASISSSGSGFPLAVNRLAEFSSLSKLLRNLKEKALFGVLGLVHSESMMSTAKFSCEHFNAFIPRSDVDRGRILRVWIVQFDWLQVRLLLCREVAKECR